MKTKIYFTLGLMIVFSIQIKRLSAQSNYFDFGQIVTYLPGSQCYGVDWYILPFVKNDGHILCFYRHAFNYPMQYYNYFSISSNLQTNTFQNPVLNNDRNGCSAASIDANYVNYVAQYQTFGKDKMQFTRYSISGDSMEFIGEKSWFPTSAFSDNWPMHLINAPNNKIYLLNSWPYSGWSVNKHDLYISYSSDSMVTWSDWILGGHINGEGEITSSSLVYDQNSNLYICMNTIWGDSCIAFFKFNASIEDFEGKLIIDQGFGSSMFLNLSTGKLAVCYIKEKKLLVKYSTLSFPANWTLPVTIIENLTNPIDGAGNTMVGGLFDHNKYYYLLTMKSEQILFEWDGDEIWEDKGIVPKSMAFNYDVKSKVLSDQNGDAIIFQSYIDWDSKNYVHVKRFTDSSNLTIDPGIQNIGFLEVVPNPFSESTIITFSNPLNYPYSSTIISLSGKKVFQQDNINSNKFEFERGNLPAGVYLVELKGEKVFRTKMVVK